VDNAQYRLLKATTPGSYTFILEGSKELPRRVMHPKRKTIGLRVPDHPVTLALLEELNEPLLTTTLQLPGDEFPLTEGWEIQDRLEDHLELILDAGHCGTEPTTVIDLTGTAPNWCVPGVARWRLSDSIESMLESLIQTLAISALPVIFAITLHEAAHGYAARHFGDSTAWQPGRISLNPLRHIDPIGTILIPSPSCCSPAVPSCSAMPSRCRSISAPAQSQAGHVLGGRSRSWANLFMALCWAFLLKMAWLMPSSEFTLPLSEMSKIGIMVNCVLMVLNLLPLPPLDGGRIAVSLLPHNLAWKFAQLERWGFRSCWCCYSPAFSVPS
jgi:Zn-dependent protease